jgi:hypothetical protein
MDTGLRAERVGFPAEAKNVSFLHIVFTGSGAEQAFSPMSTEDLSME